MKHHILFVDEYDSSKYNGIGTYRDVLVPILGSNVDIELSLISLNSESDNLEIIERDYGVEYKFPIVDYGNWRACGELIWPLLSQYICDSFTNIFMFNHSPAAEFIESMQRIFPQSKSIFVVHDQGWCASLFGDGTLLSKIEKGKAPHKLNPKVCDSVHSYCDKERAIYKIVDAVVCLSESTERYLLDIYGVPAEKVHKIYNGYLSDCKGLVRRNSARKRVGLLPDDEVLIFVARSVPHKGIIAMLKAVKLLRKSHPKLRCVLAGIPGGFINYWNIGKTIASNIILPGQLNQKELKLWLSASDIGVLSSYTEQCSYAALEMMNAGIPIVSSDGNGLCDMFEDGKDAFVVHIGNVRQVDKYAKRLAQKINQALTATEQEKCKLKKAARKKLRTKYSEKLMASKYIELFNSLTDND